MPPIIVSSDTPMNCAVCDIERKYGLRKNVFIVGDEDQSIYSFRGSNIQYITRFKNIEKVELLPYHTMGVPKYHKLGIPYRLEGTPDMDINRCKELERLLNS